MNASSGFHLGVVDGDLSSCMRATNLTSLSSQNAIKALKTHSCLVCFFLLSPTPSLWHLLALTFILCHFVVVHMAYDLVPPTVASK